MLGTAAIQNDSLTDIIDRIIDHHYFQSKITQLMQDRKPHQSQSEVEGLLDDVYYKAEQEVVDEIAQLMSATADSQVRNVLAKEFINVTQEIQAIKNQMFVFMEEQTKKGDQLFKEIHKLAEDAKRRNNTNQVLSNTAVVHSNGYTGGIRFLRSGGTTPQTNNAVENKSFHSELTAIRKEIEELKQSMEKGEIVKVIEQQFNQFKIETKVALEAIKLQAKKMTIQLNTLSKSSSGAQSLKESIEGSVKRTIAAQLKVYGSYSDNINEMKQQVQKLQDRVTHQGQLHNQYLSNQLKSVWLVLNDMKRTLDEVTENIGLNSSRDIL